MNPEPTADSSLTHLLRFCSYLCMRCFSLRPRKDLFLEEKFYRIKKHYGADCLDVGSGYGDFTHFLSSHGVATTGIDVVNKGRHGDSKTQLFDGKTIPFPTDSFDTSIAMFVLHHAQDQRWLLKELGRVARHRVIIAEDVIETFVDKLLGSVHLRTSVWSEAKNSFHPDKEWRRRFEQLGWRLLEVIEISRCKAPFYPVNRRVYVLAPGLT